VFNPGNSEVFVKKNTEIALFTQVKDVVESLTHQDMTVCNVHVSEGCENLSPEQASEFKTFLLNYQTTFAGPNKPAQRVNLGEHCIELSDETPFKEPVRRVPIFRRGLMRITIAYLLSAYSCRRQPGLFPMDRKRPHEIRTLVTRRALIQKKSTFSRWPTTYWKKCLDTLRLMPVCV
jgi:hypothetical protein